MGMIIEGMDGQGIIDIGIVWMIESLDVCHWFNGNIVRYLCMSTTLRYVYLDKSNAN